MTGKASVNGSGNGARSGAQTLALLSIPTNPAILRALAQGPRQQAELRRATRAPALTTLRVQLRKLAEVGAIEKRRRNSFPGSLDYELTAAGRDLLLVIDVLERWLGEAPGGPLPLDANAAKAAVKALTDSWSARIVRALAAGALSLTELDALIAGLSYPSLERRLVAMRLSGLVEAAPTSGRGTPYAATPWLRRSLAPLAAAARWERRHAPHATAPIGGLDVEAAFLLATPFLRPPLELNGSCSLAAEIWRGDKRRLAGAVIRLRDGAIESCSARLEGAADATALGPAIGWLDAVLEGGHADLEFGGNRRMAAALVDCLHEALVGTDRVRALDSDSAIDDDRSN